MKDEDEIQPATNWFQQFKMELDARKYRVVDAYYRRDKGFYMVEVPRHEFTLDPGAISSRLEYFATHWFSTAFGDKVWVSVQPPIAPRPDLRFVKVTVPSAVREDFDPEEVETLAGSGFYDEERQRLIRLKAALELRDFRAETILQVNLDHNGRAQIQVVGRGGIIPQAITDEVSLFLDQFAKAGKPMPDEMIQRRVTDLLVSVYWSRVLEEVCKEIGIEITHGPQAHASVAHFHSVVIDAEIKSVTSLKGVVTLSKVVPDDYAPGAEVEESAGFDPEEVEDLAASWEQGSKTKLMHFLKPLEKEGFKVVSARVRRTNDKTEKVVSVAIKPEGLLADDFILYRTQAQTSMWAIALTQRERAFMRELNSILGIQFPQTRTDGIYYGESFGGLFLYMITLESNDERVDANTVVGDESIWKTKWRW